MNKFVVIFFIEGTLLVRNTLQDEHCLTRLFENANGAILEAEKAKDTVIQNCPNAIFVVEEWDGVPFGGGKFIRTVWDTRPPASGR